MAKKWPNGQTKLFLAKSFKKAKWQPCLILRNNWALDSYVVKTIKYEVNLPNYALKA